MAQAGFLFTCEDSMNNAIPTPIWSLKSPPIEPDPQPEPKPDPEREPGSDPDVRPALDPEPEPMPM